MFFHLRWQDEQVVWSSKRLLSHFFTVLEEYITILSCILILSRETQEYWISVEGVVGSSGLEDWTPLDDWHRHHH